MTNSELLKKAIDNSGYKLRFIAKKLNISYQALQHKINNNSEFKQSEITIICNLLQIPSKERELIFFTD